MTDKLKQTVRIVRKTRILTDERGRSVWNAPIEETEMELVSTATLKTLIESGDGEKRRRLAEVAAGKDGVLAQSPQSGSFEIIDDDDLMAALGSAADTPDKIDAAEFHEEPLLERADTRDEELSLVSTQALRIMLEIDETGSDDESDESDAGFDPYNKV